MAVAAVQCGTARSTFCPPCHLLFVDQAALLQRQTSGAAQCAQQSREDVEQGGRGMPCKHMTDVTGVEISWARDFQRDQQNLLLREIVSDGREDLIELPVHDCYRQTVTNLSSTVLNTKFENAHLFLSKYAGNSHTNNLCSQMILKGSSCIPAILLRVQRRILRKGKHSGRCDCTLSSTVFF